MEPAMSFVKLDCGILDSSLWAESPEFCKVFLTMLAMSDSEGLCPATAPGISARARVELETTRAALTRLEAPDPDDRSGVNEGRRISRVPGGYLITNYLKYRDHDYGAADRAKRYRERRRVTIVTRDGRDGSRNVTQAEAEAEAEAEGEYVSERPETVGPSIRVPDPVPVPVPPVPGVVPMAAPRPPMVRCGAKEVGEFRATWAAVGFVPIPNWHPRMDALLWERMQDEFFRGAWREALLRASMSPFLTGRVDGYKFSEKKFLEEGMVEDILSGKYDARKKREPEEDPEKQKRMLERVDAIARRRGLVQDPATKSWSLPKEVKR